MTSLLLLQLVIVDDVVMKKNLFSVKGQVMSCELHRNNQTICTDISPKVVDDSAKNFGLNFAHNGGKYMVS